MSRKSVCFANLKGGVGKSTLSVAFAEYLAFVKDQRVLVIDGDPQGNSTLMLVGSETAEKFDRERRTFFDLIGEFLDGSRVLRPSDFIEDSVSNISKVCPGSISLVPSTIRFTGYEHFVIREMTKHNKTSDAIHGSVSKIVGKLERYCIEAYDWVIVDAPPSFGMQARLVMRLARHAVIPTTADPLSGHGVSHVVDRLRRHRLRTRPLCVVISKFRQQSDTARQFRSAAKKRENPPVGLNWPQLLRSVIPEGASLQRIADYGQFNPKPGSVREKYRDKAAVVAQMSEEIIQLIEAKSETL